MKNRLGILIDDPWYCDLCGNPLTLDEYQFNDNVCDCCKEEIKLGLDNEY